jgi:MFS transporter, OFA family, oxalate/formate antiporter
MRVPDPADQGGTMPAFAADYFGPRNVGSVSGLMLTAWP